MEQEVAAGVPSASVVVGGFSQGGAVALLMLRSQVGAFLRGAGCPCVPPPPPSALTPGAPSPPARAQLQLAGVLGLSTYLPLHEEAPVVSGAARVGNQLGAGGGAGPAGRRGVG